MPYTIFSNASVGVQTTHQTASEALAAALQLGATAHRTIGIADASGRSLTLAEREREVLAGAPRPLTP